MAGAIVIGAGPGIGVSVARRFARQGLPIGVVARTRPTVDAALRALAGTNVDTYGEQPTQPTRRHCAPRSIGSWNASAFPMCSSTTLR